MEEENPKYKELIQNHQRDINCIIDEDRNLRKRGLMNILKGVFESKNEPTVVLHIFQANLVKNLIKGFEDQIEKNRELSYQILDKLFNFIPGNEQMLDRDLIINLMRVIAARLNQIPFPEQSEEIRLSIVEILRKFLKHYDNEFLPILQEITLSISKALQDSYPNLKKATAQFVMEISEKLSKHIGHHNTSIVKALSMNLKHQHSRVRNVTIQALVCILLTQSGGQAIEHVMQFWHKIVFDANNDVRKAAFEGIGKLLTGFSIGNLKQYETELLQLLLNGLSDDIPEICIETQKILEEVGLRRKVLCIEMQENIEEFV